jgi:hypothetical protein
VGLLGAVRYWKDEDSSLGFLGYSAHLALEGDLQQRSASLAANVNKIRRVAPFAYLFANGFTVHSWREEDIGENDCRNSLDTHQLSHGFWLGAPTWDDPTDTVVSAILYGDITPFVHLLAQEDFALYCSRFHQSLTSIDRVTCDKVNSRAAAKALLMDGGCVITAIDQVVFHVYSIDDRYGQFFS